MKGKWISIVLAVALVALAIPSVIAAPEAPLDATYQSLPFSQSWSTTSLITVDDDWSGVPGIVGYLGNYTTSTPTGVDPQTLLSDYASTSIDVIANQTNTTITNGGVAEFEITDPVVALQGSGTADAPFLLIHLNTTGFTSIQVSYNVRDIDGSSDNAVQQVALHYRVGTSGDFTNVATGYIADATSGPSLATLVTNVNVTLPAAVNDQAQVQLRIMTTNAAGNDEWVGVDDLTVIAQPATAITLRTLSAASPSPVSAQLAGLALLGGLVVFVRRRRA